jgi:hypothetical protein
MGQRVFYTTTEGKSWDGNINGKLAGTGTYVWMTSGIDYTGKQVEKKGTVILIR